MNKDIKKTGTAEPVKKAVGKDNVLKKVINVTKSKIPASDYENLMNRIIDNSDIQDVKLKSAAKELVANSWKSAISSEHPELYKAFAKMDYDKLKQCLNLSKINGKNSDMLEFTVPQSFLDENINSGIVYDTTFSISPNSFWSNMTNILNEVSVGDNYINTGKSFNAWNFFRSYSLSSGEAALRTLGQTLSGVCLLNQNQLVPPNTQMLKGYQASLGVFINAESPQDVGGGTGMGLFVMYSTPINVLKLAVTNPQQFADTVRIFQATAINTREYTLWNITTYNMLSNISNIIVDNYNTNIRNCLNGTLFPAIEKMKNPTNEFNCGLIETAIVNQNNNQFTNLIPVSYFDFMENSVYSAVLKDTDIYTIRYYTNQSLNLTNPDGSTNTTLINANSFSSPYMVPGSASMPRIQTSTDKEMYLIVSPEFLVGFKSGTASQLFHWEFQSLTNYIPPENIFMLYKQVNIPSGYLNDATVTNDNGNLGYAWNVPAMLGDRWFPENVIYLITKPTDINQWTANYGYVWTAEMSNEWGAGMINTSFLHFAFYGGVLPWSNGCCFYFKNLMNLVSDNTQAIMTDFTLGVAINQGQTITTENGSGQN